MNKNGGQTRKAAVLGKPRTRFAAGGVACALLLLAAAGILLYYIFGPSIGFLHSDCTDSLLWAWTTLETGDVLSGDFYYAALLPFGSSLWMVPVLSVFGYTVTAHQISMAIFALLFLAAAFWLFRSLDWSPVPAAGGAFVLSMLLSGSVKLREIMWEHTIYYSLSILLIMVMVPLSLWVMRSLEDTDKGATTRLLVGTVLLWLLCVGCGLDGMQVSVITVVPVAGAWFLWRLADDTVPLFDRRTTRPAALLCVMGVGVLCGLVLLSAITKKEGIVAGYENAYSGWSAFASWDDNARAFVPHFLSLFGVEAHEGDRLFSLDSVATMLRLVTAWCVLLLPFLLFTKYRRLKSRGVKVMLWTHVLLSAAVLFGFICGTLSSANWRLTPLLGTGIITALLYVRELFGGSVLEKRAAGVLAAVMVITALFGGATMLTVKDDSGDTDSIIAITETLEQKGCTYGYATFWNAQRTTLLSDNSVMTIPMTVEKAGLFVYNYQIRDAWVETDSNRGKYFLLFTDGEYQVFKVSDGYTKIADHLLEEYEQGGYRVVITSRNPLF